VVRKKETDISLIRKYLDGELDARAMHRLERRAQDDPFLMDALEGYEKSGGDQQANLDELTDRLQLRVAKKERHIIPLRFIAAAACMLLFLTTGGLWLYKSRQQKPEIAQLIKPTVKTAPVAPKNPVSPVDAQQTALTQTSSKKHFRKPRIASKPGKLPAASIAANEQIANVDFKASAKDTIALKEVTVTGYATQRKKDITASVATITNDSAAKPPVTILLRGQASGVRMVSAHPAKKIIKGRVIGSDDGLPIVGANVKLVGTNIGAVTDVNGMFSIPADSTKTKLAIAYIGYTSRQVNIRNRDTLATIKLEPANSALTEVVVTGYTSQAKPEAASVIGAHPSAGWSNFKKYLKENAFSPDGKTGVVKLSMSVAPNGTISDIKIEKGVSAATDQKAIDLINDGPSWAGSTSGKIEKIRVRIKFIN